MIEGLGKYSTIKTEIFEYENSDRKKCLRKVYKPNILDIVSLSEIKQMTDRYYNQLSNVLNRVPKILNSEIKENCIIYNVEKRGKNIFDMNFDIKTFDNFKVYIEKMVDMLNEAFISGIYIDPHPKNFVVEGDEVFYVDFFPPYSEEYNEKVLDKFKGNKESYQIVKKNLGYFKGIDIFPHFCGDFLNINKNYIKLFGEIFNLIKPLVRDFYNYEEFVKKANEIRNLEDLRIEKGVYLV